MTNKPLVAPADCKRHDSRYQALTQWFYGFNSRLVLPSTDPVVLWVHFPVGAGSSHTKDFKNGNGPCLHDNQDEVGTTKHNWSAWCQYNVNGWVSMWAYDMLSQ